jgi:GT2 family glycosyltransferase
MPPDQRLPTVPRVAAVLVVHDGAAWLPSVLATLAASEYPKLDLIVVDNASKDGSADVLARRIPADRLITLPRNLGFARAVAAALNHPAVAEADLLLFLHDDLVLAPDAITELVRAVRDDRSLGIVGPKLREWSDDGVISELGMTIDRFGRAEPRVEPGELDQGQHDRQAEVLYVSTAGMLITRELYRQLGGFDARFPAYRDDLDLCWRAWLRDARVEVVPDAVGYHIAAGARAGRRFGGGTHGARYLAERHAIAAMLKNYSRLSLAWALPVTTLLAVIRMVAYLVVRRFADAGALLRALLWNITELPRTMRRRRAVQRRRAVPDRQVIRLFAPGLPRVRTYAEAIGAWLAGGSTRALIDEEAVVAAEEDRLAGRTLLRMMRDRPALVVGGLLLLAYLIGLAPLLGPGQVVGGDIAPWPASARDFLRAYATPHGGDPLGTAGFASPVQAVLGLATFLGLGNQWLAQRLLVFGLVPLAWLFALRAGRLITSQPGPRALGATLYALSPVVLGVLAQGRYGALVVAAVLPGLVTVGVRATDPQAQPATSWRATALMALGLALGIASAPSMGPLLLAAVGAGIVVVLRQPNGRQAALRLAVAGAAALAMVSPWLLTLATGGRPFVGVAEQGARLPLWRAITGVPDVLPGLGGVGGLLTALASGAVVVGSVLLGLRRRPDVVAVLALVGSVTALAAWGADRLNIGLVWPPAMLLPTALALAGLAVLAARSLSGGLRQYAFGARQLSVVIAVVLLGIGLFAAVVRLAAGPYTGLARAPEIVPAFVSADVPQVGPYRVLLLADRGGEMHWDLSAAAGPSMIRFGTTSSRELLGTLESAVSAIAGGGDPRAGAGLGAINVRYVVVTHDGTSEALARALADQPALEPIPTGAGRVYRVRSWLPRAVVVPTAMATRLATTGDPGSTASLQDFGLRPIGPATFRGAAPAAGLLLLGESAGGWRASAGGETLPRESLRLPIGEGLELPTWAVAEPSLLQVEPSGELGHGLVLAFQALLVLAVISLALRPPGFTQRREQRQRGANLPRQLAQPMGRRRPLDEDPAPEEPGRAGGTGPQQDGGGTPERGPTRPAPITEELNP